MTGDLSAAERVLVPASGGVIGTIRATRVAVEDGCRMNRGAQTPDNRGRADPIRVLEDGEAWLS